MYLLLVRIRSEKTHLRIKFLWFFDALVYHTVLMSNVQYSKLAFSNASPGKACDAQSA